jgi:hypothetical protein
MKLNIQLAHLGAALLLPFLATTAIAADAEKPQPAKESRGGTTTGKDATKTPAENAKDSTTSPDATSKDKDAKDKKDKEKKAKKEKNAKAKKGDPKAEKKDASTPSIETGAGTDKGTPSQPAGTKPNQ